MTKKYKVGFIGTGMMAQYHLSLLKKMVRNKKIPEFNLIGCYDTQLKKSTWFSKLNHCKNYQSFKKFISEGSPDIVYLCTPPFARINYETVLIKRNINYFVEKPPTICSQYRLLRHLTSDKLKKIFIQPGFQWRYFDFNKNLKNFIKNDQIRLVIGSRLNPLPFHDWRLDKSLSGGPIFDRVIHMVDFCKFIFGGNLKILKHYQNRCVLSKKIDKKCNLSDSEILIFKINDILCNISTANYLQGNNILEMKFIGKENIYKIFLNRPNLMVLQIINNNKIIKEFTEQKDQAFERENIIFWQSIFKNKDLGLVDYRECLRLASLIKKALKCNC